MSTPLNGLQKAATLLISLGTEVAVQVLKHLTPTEVEQLTAEISRLHQIPVSVARSVLEEFQQLAGTPTATLQGGLGYVRTVLERVVGRDRAEEIVERLSAGQSGTLTVVRRIDPRNLLNFIRREHPQTIALILANLEPSRAAKLLAELPPDLQIEVIRRIATLDKTGPEILSEIEAVLEERLASLFQPEVSPQGGGVKAAAEILNQVSRTHEQNILEGLEQVDGALAEHIRNLMFTFEDLILVDDRGIQRVLREVNQRDLAIALKAAGEEVRTKIFKNMSERARTILKEEIEDLGPVRLREVEEAQRKIVTIVRALQEAGEIVVQGRGREDGDILI